MNNDLLIHRRNSPKGQIAVWKVYSKKTYFVTVGSKQRSNVKRVFSSSNLDSAIGFACGFADSFKR